MQNIIFGIVISNIVGFLIMGIDKFKAKRGSRRIPEKNLLLVALMGGAVGVFVGMQLFRHKTQHKSFVLGVPLLIVLNLVYYYLLL